MDLIPLQGKVVLVNISPGSKSEQVSAWLDTGNLKYRLRKAQGNPFQDNSLLSLEGKTIRVKGRLITADFFEIWNDPEIIPEV